MPLFKKTKILEFKMDEFLDTVSESVLVFSKGLKNYFSGEKDIFEEEVKRLHSQESKADKLRRSIEEQLYLETLIPESRGDVLALLETADDVIDQARSTLLEFSVETPMIPKQFHSEFIKLTEAAIKTVDEMTMAMRSFFKKPTDVRNHIHKVYFYEKEADSCAEQLKRAVFSNKELKLSEKIHLRYFALHIDTIADKAEDVADRLGIYSIKRFV